MPDDTGAWIPRKELQRRLRAMGCRVSEAQLEEWHKHDLIARPKRQSLGRGRGTVSAYPAGALLQAAAVAWLLDRVRSFDMVSWYLWTFGLLPAARGRSFLQEGIKKEMAWATEALQALEQEERSTGLAGVSP